MPTTCGPSPGKAVVDDEEVVADRVVAVDVALSRDHRRGRRRPHLVVEDLIAQRLRGGDLRLGRRQPDIELRPSGASAASPSSRCAATVVACLLAENAIVASLPPCPSGGV